MNHENVSSADRGEDELDEQEKLAWNHFEIRREAKDLRLILGHTAESFPHRDKLFQLVEEILTLVPVYDTSDEEKDELKRKQLAEQIQASAREYAEWKKGRE
jgi:hypothetical protein